MKFLFIKSSRTFFFLLFLIVFQLHAEEISERYPLIPKPVSLTPSSGSFCINEKTKLAIYPYNSATKEFAAFICEFFKGAFGKELEIVKGQNSNQHETINIVIENKPECNLEGYFLQVAPEFVTIRAQSKEGAFWAFQTLRQLMPASSERKNVKCDAFSIPCCTIQDYPRFAYRGLHLDVSRHMFPVEFIKKYIDLLASYKLNVFHMHLTDDQGWRVEIKKYPKLQEVAAFRDETLIGHRNDLIHFYDKKRYGGFYTQEEIKALVEYARKRSVAIIPEIELPGHSLAALAAYPELGCKKGPYKTATTWGIFKDIYCAGNDKTFQFLEDVLSEVMELFPSKYIHIGGDEAPKASWKKCPKCQKRIKKERLRNEEELQSYFIRRIEKFLNKKGRQIIGWDEILEGGLAPNATVMSWRGVEGGIDAAKEHHFVVMTPNKALYFDHYQSKSKKEPLAIGGYTTLKKVYQYEPVPEVLKNKEASFILGAQGNVWTEYIKTKEQVEYMTYPRAIALAEVVWSQAESKDFANFLERLKINLEHLKAQDVHFAEHALEE